MAELKLKIFGYVEIDPLPSHLRKNQRRKKSFLLKLSYFDRISNF